MRKFKDLKDRVLAERERNARVDAYKAELLSELSLAELRRARQKTQEELAQALETTQSGISRLEHQADLYVSTLRKYVEAVGGRLEIDAVFPDARIPIATFGRLDEEIETDAGKTLEADIRPAGVARSQSSHGGSGSSPHRYRL